MPWKERSVMDERIRFVIRLKDGETMASLCREFGISRKTGYKILERYEEYGWEGLTDRARRPHRYANALPVQMEAAIIRKHFPKAKIVADRFHVIRLVNHHFLACWREIDPTGSKHHGLVSLLRRHRHHLKPEQRNKLEQYFEQFPALRALSLQTTALLLTAEETPNAQAVRSSGEPFSQSPARVESGRPVAARATPPNDGILVRRDCDHVAIYSQQRNHRGLPHKNGSSAPAAYGFRNFKNYRLRVRIMCS